LAALAATGGPCLQAAELSPTVRVAAEDGGSRFVALGIGKSLGVDLPRDIKDVLVANPAIAHAVGRSAPRAYLISSAMGQIGPQSRARAPISSRAASFRSSPATPAKSPAGSTPASPRCNSRSSASA